MSGLFANGHIADVVLVFMALEIFALVAFRRVSGRGLAAFDTIVLILPGLFLLLALRAALTGSDWTMIAGCLAASLVAHLADLWRRLA